MRSKERDKPHEDLGTTQRYVHLKPAAIRSAIDLLEQPAPARIH
jgi:hypothetical protein